MAESSIWAKVFPTGADTGGPGWAVLSVTDGDPVIVSWPAVTEGPPAGYEIEIDGGAPTDAGNVTAYSATGLSEGEHIFRVRPYNADNEYGSWSAPAVGNAVSWNEATGGTLTVVQNYNGTGETWNVHTFTANGDFVVSRASKDFEVCYVGGGGGGCNGGGGGGNSGGGGKGARLAMPIAAGTYPIVIGGGGSGGDVNDGGDGGATTCFGLTGAGGTAGHSWGTGYGGMAIQDSIRGVLDWYGHNPGPRAYTVVGYGGGGGGGAESGNWGYGGAGGAVVVAYRVG